MEELDPFRRFLLDVLPDIDFFEGGEVALRGTVGGGMGLGPEGEEVSSVPSPCNILKLCATAELKEEATPPEDPGEELGGGRDEGGPLDGEGRGAGADPTHFGATAELEGEALSPEKPGEELEGGRDDGVQLGGGGRGAGAGAGADPTHLGLRHFPLFLHLFLFLFLQFVQSEMQSGMRQFAHSFRQDVHIPKPLESLGKYFQVET